ncbi:efflux RND transporter periplasmic adaptor subunit [Vibrio albus]|uniref:Efflux RND transporter periplasmic adaptor subunit n=1 Tax=Vibrio albus TaxID=2200953 RepID=A0A2U3BEU7_9VIBR|nr:efflux RND transporter periplasmic adaptor subunit [Vibrio albus]PWI35318.1 efflux RND transporter periplasmic adaptor subunit [Vibrio albus]
MMTFKGYFSRRPWLISLLLFIAIGFWLSLGSGEADAPHPGSKGAFQVPLARVVYQTFQAQETAKTVELYGRTAPDRQARIGAEISGRVIALDAAKGSRVKKGQPIISLDQSDLVSQLQRAKALLDVREKEFKAAKSLKSRGLQGEVAYSNAQSNLVEARAAVKRAQLNLNNTTIRAPFDGILDDQMVEVGNFVGVGDPVASVLDLDKIVIEADVSERHVQRLKVGETAKVRFIDGQLTEGTVRYVSKISSPATNTFPIEVEIPNPNNQIPAGVSAEVNLELDLQQAVKITPAMLALDKDGNLGVKALYPVEPASESDEADSQRRVYFIPVQLVKAEQDGVWLSGLGENADIITIGQGFVREGDLVHAVKAESVKGQQIGSANLSATEK